MSERPTVAFVLSLIAGICYLVVGILFALAGAVVGGVPGSLVPGLGAVFLVILSIGLVSGVLMVVGAVVMRSTDRSRVRTGSVLTRRLHLRFLHLRFLHLPRFPNPPRDSGERRRRAEREAPLNLGAAVATVRGKSFGLFRHGIPKRFYRVEQESGERV
ncbi:MAG: hypothetical protein E6K90_06220 [Thaumarchaeota archaeon]|nr:MAG: hypothetical protein E6K90_06220 [Nitrososphaerota archaeon]